MNPQLHAKWNAERDPNRGSDKEGPQILTEDTAKNKVILKKSKPR